MTFPKAVQLLKGCDRFVVPNAEKVSPTVFAKLNWKLPPAVNVGPVNVIGVAQSFKPGWIAIDVGEFNPLAKTVPTIPLDGHLTIVPLPAFAT